MSEEDQKPWVGYLPGLEREGVIAGTREGLLQLRSVLDEAIEKGTANPSDIWSDILEIRRVDRVPKEKREPRGAAHSIGISLAIVVVLFAFISLVVGAAQIFKWLV